MANKYGRKGGDPSIRFWEKVNKTDSCWLWTANKNNKGYGFFYYRRKYMLAHRVSLILNGVEIPEGKVVDHLCRVPACIKPDHLEVVTQRENLLRGKGPIPENARKTRCKHGHLLSGVNLYIYGKLNKRVCKTCRRKRQKNPPVARICRTCNAEFWVWPYRAKSRKGLYCSSECQHESMRDKSRVK